MIPLNFDFKFNDPKISTLDSMTPKPRKLRKTPKLKRYEFSALALLTLRFLTPSLHRLKKKLLLHYKL